MNKYFVNFVLLIVGLFGSEVFGADNTTNTASGWKPTVSLRSVYASKYLVFGTGAVLYDKPVIQTDLFVSFRNGVYLDLWNSTPFEGYNRNFGTEQDFGIGWAGPLSKFGVKGPLSSITLDIGTTYFDEPKVLTFGAKDILWSHAKLTKEFKWATIYGSFDNFLEMPGSPYKGGNVATFGASKGTSMFNGLLNPSTSLALVYDNGGFGNDRGFLLKGGAELDWRITKRVTLILPQVTYYAPVGVDDSRKLDCVWFAGFCYKF